MLYGRMMLPKSSASPKRLVLIPPLIGAGASQGLIIFRNLTRRGCALLSFEYRGHSHSTGVFELDRTIVDTRNAVRWAADYACRHDMPLHAITMCYAFVSLAAQFRYEHWPRSLRSINAVSGLFRLDQILRFEDFAPLFVERVGVDLDRALHPEQADDEVDWASDAFRGALRRYLSDLFPELRVGRDFFEELSYERVNIRRTLAQLSDARYLDDVVVPPEVSCNVVYGRRDNIMAIETDAGRAGYRQQAQTLMPHAVFREWDVDHYGFGPDREALIQGLGDFMEECDAREPSSERMPAHRRRYPR